MAQEGNGQLSPMQGEEGGPSGGGVSLGLGRPRFKFYAPSRTLCVTSAKIPNLPKPQSPSVKQEEEVIALHCLGWELRCVFRYTWGYVLKVVRGSKVPQIDRISVKDSTNDPVNTTKQNK